METMETKVNTTNETESAVHPAGVMDINDFDYDLPEELIAQDPIEDRSSSRLLLLDKKTGKTQDKIFRDIIDELNPGDCLVINNTKVIPARLMGVKEDTGAHIEVLLLKREQDDVWEVLVKPGKKAKPGTIITFGDGRLKAEVLEVVEDGNRKIRFSYQGIFEEILDELGQMPLPPYITHQLKDKNRYQTVYAKYEGSAAAPTAGLHFTKDLLKKIEEKGVVIAANYWGKVKTVVQMLMSIVLILDFSFSGAELLEWILIWAAVVLTVISLLDYIYKNRAVLSDTETR